MARVRLYRDEVEPGELPRVCMACGGPAAIEVRKQFAWHPPWVWVLILAGLLPFVLVAILLTRRRAVHAPLCPQHRNHWYWRAWVVFGGLGAVALVWLLTVVLVASVDRPHDRHGVLLSIISFFGGLGLLLVWLIVSIIVRISAIRPTEIADRTITLTNVSGRFVEEFERLLEDRRAARDARDATDFTPPHRRLPPHPDAGLDQYTR